MCTTGEWRPKTAMVLAAGLGTRMRPLTDKVPKPLVVLHGRTLLDHVLDGIAKAGIGEAVVNVHYMAGQIEAHLASRTTPRIVISDERDGLLETGGGVVRALAKLGDEPFLIHNSDSVWIEKGCSNIVRMARLWDPGKMDSLLLLAPRATSLGYDGKGDFDLAEDGRVARRTGERESAYVFAGVSIAAPALFAGAPEGAFSLNRLWDRAMRDGRLYGICLEGTWMHVGTPEALSDAARMMEREEAGS